MARAGERSRNIDLLIIEDQGVMRALLRDFLQSNFPDLAIGEAGDGSRALTLVRACRPRVVLIDIHLPDSNGIELTAHVKALLPDTHVIIVTNQKGAAYIERAHAAGAFEYVTKEKIHTELLPIVGRALALPRSRDGEESPE